MQFQCHVMFPGNQIIVHTGKSFLEALILASTTPQYDKRLFIDLPVLYLKTISSEQLCTYIVLNVKTKTKKQFMHTTCSELVVFMYRTGKSKINLLSHCGLVARIRASNKDLPVQHQLF